MRVRILSDAITFGDVGDVVDPPAGFVVSAAVKAGLVATVAKKARASTKKPAKKGDA